MAIELSKVPLVAALGLACIVGATALVHGEELLIAPTIDRSGGRRARSQ